MIQHMKHRYPGKATLKWVGFSSILTLILTGSISMVLMAAPNLPRAEMMLYIARPLEFHSTLYIHDLRHDLAAPLFDLLGEQVDAAWSPDGNEIAYSSFDADVVHRQIHIYSLETGQSRQVTSGKRDHGSPDWSPDGKRLVYHARELIETGTWDVYVHDLESNEIVQLFDGGMRDGRPAWSPDGRFLAFESEDERVFYTHLYLMEVETGLIRKVTDTAANTLAAAWSPDGTQVAYTVHLIQSTDLYVMNLDDARMPQQVTNLPLNLDPVWSPDGRSLAFSTRLPQDNHHQHIYVVDLETGDIRRLTNGTRGYQSPDWAFRQGQKVPSTPILR